MEDEWTSIEEPTQEELDKQQEELEQDNKKLLGIGQKKSKDAASKYGIQGANKEAFEKRHQQISALLQGGQEKDAPDANEEGDFNDVTNSNGCRPWVGAIRAPTSYVKNPNLSKKPEVNLELEYIHGYRSKDCRNNVKYLEGGKLLFNSAGVAVIQDIATNTQKFFTRHSDDVTAIAINKEHTLVATGQVSDTSKSCPIYIWKVDTMEVVHKVKGGVSKGCGLLSFSPDGSKLVSLSVNDNHDITIIDVKTGAVLKSVSGGSDKLFSCKWRDDNLIVTAGEKHLRLWNFADGMSQKRGIWGANKCSTKIIGLSINPINKDILLGAGDGSVQVFKMNTCTKVLPLHANKIVDALNFSEGFILTGGRDSTICILDAKDYTLLHRIDAAKVLTNSLCPKIRSLQFTKDCQSLIVATFGSEIYQIKLTRNGNTFAVQAFKQLLAGHFSPNGSWTNEVWGLDLSPKDPDQYATVSDDATLRIWSISQRKQLKGVNLNIDINGQPLPLDLKNNNDYFDSSKARALGIAPNGDGYLVGFKDGTLRFLDSDLKLNKVFKHAKEWISAIKFSPNGDLVAVGSHDNVIYLYSFPQLKLVNKLDKHSSFITHLDFSQNGENLRSVCGAYDLLYWNIKDGSHLTAGATMLRDVEWHTNSCIFGWPVQKMWKKSYNDYTDINAVDRSHQKINGDYILANGDDYSTVNLFKWPCVNSNAQCIEGKGHCSHVTAVRFAQDDKHLITTGGEDNCVFLWKITPN